MDFSQIVTYVAPAAILIAGLRWTVGILWKRFSAWVDERSEATDKKQAEILVELGLIKGQTTTTNGRVTVMEREIATLQGAVFGPHAIEMQEPKGQV